MNARGVVFDIGGVLELTPATGWRRTWESRLALAPGDIDRVLGPVWEAGAVGAITESGVRTEIMTRLGLGDTGADAFLADLWDEYLGAPNTALIAFVRELPHRFPGCRLGVLSNSFTGAREREDAAYGFGALFARLVYSHECGLLKPDPRAYALVCDGLGLRPGDCLFVDDLPANTEAAEAAGMRAALFTGNEAVTAAITRHLGREGSGSSEGSRGSGNSRSSQGSQSSQGSGA
ncbi:HAD-IA family hydrolase [Streptomyces sp. NPDC058953]|uniref:HAD-IA family hydrolase n=1 Tax=unclassified Streptomyces TaxID=2593676 RepID=UPI0036BD949B